jgi:hypothetical protein
MRRRLLVRHFLNQFVENDFSPDVDRHQLFAVAAAALITIPLFATVFMSVKYLMQPLQSPGWTGMTTMSDQVIFCATSLLVSATIATLEWDALALSHRDSMTLGVLPLPRAEIVRAKVTALVTFAAAFVISLNALPTLMHPPLTVANFRASPLLLVPLVAAHSISTRAAGRRSPCVVGLRELLFLCLGERYFSRIAGTIRSALLFSFLVLLVLAPIQLSGRTAWMFEASRVPVLLQPVSWFAATHAAIAGRVLDTLPTPDLPARLSADENRLRTQYRNSLPHLTALALRGTGILAAVLTMTMGVYLRNARRFHCCQRGSSGQRSAHRASATAWRRCSRGGRPVGPVCCSSLEPWRAIPTSRPRHRVRGNRPGFGDHVSTRRAVRTRKRSRTDPTSSSRSNPDAHRGGGGISRGPAHVGGRPCRMDFWRRGG